MNIGYALFAIRQDINKHWRVLDVGCRSGGRCNCFVEAGCDVTGIDIKRYADDYTGKGFRFEQSSLEDFRSDTPFDVVAATYVLPFVKCTWDQRMAHVVRLMAPSGFLITNVFTTEDGWHGNPDISTIGAAEFDDLLKRHQLAVSYRSHEQYRGPTYDGFVKFWSVIQVIARLPG